jgi:hypothetical protein
VNQAFRPIVGAFIRQVPPNKSFQPTRRNHRDFGFQMRFNVVSIYYSHPAGG